MTEIIVMQESIGYYGKAVTLSPEFSFAAANRALAMYQVGQTEASIREMRSEQSPLCLQPGYACLHLT